MNKSPIDAVIITIIAVIVLYLFTDIKPNKKNKAATETATNTTTETESYISSFNQSLATETQQSINNWLALAQNNNDTLALDSLIQQYENLEQYNFSAYYHSLKAKIINSKESWELAGDRQLSVSQNTAYDSAFNKILMEKAIESYGNALKYDTTNLNIKTKLGEAYMLNPNQPMQGITMLLDVVKQDSMHVAANLALGKFGIISGQYDKALIRLEKVLSLQPENTEALLLSAEAATNLGNLLYAIDKLEKGKKLVESEEFKENIDMLIEQLKNKL